jgi:transcriptional regulator with XRE-family HTH domain
MKDKLKAPNEYRAATEILKRELKKRGLTYQHLAAEIGLSESGIKKILAGYDGSFQRLAQICKVAGLAMADLFSDQETVDVDFSVEQQKAFLKEPRLFDFYWLLVYERRPLPQAQEELHRDITKCCGWKLSWNSLLGSFAV